MDPKGSGSGASSSSQKPTGHTICTQTTGLYSLPGLLHLEEYDIIIGESIPREDQYPRRSNSSTTSSSCGKDDRSYERNRTEEPRKPFLIDKGPAYNPSQPQRVGGKPVQAVQPLPAQPTAPREVATGPPQLADSGEGPSYGGKVHMVTYDGIDESTLRVVIDNFSKMADTLCSDPKRISDVPWRIMVMPKQHMVQKKSQKCMGFFLQCCPDNTFSDQWSCHAVAEMRLLSEKQNVQNFVRKTTHIYTAKENDWGYSCFMTWADVLDENQGYIKNDRVTLEISVKADAPKNMMTREEFRKTLDRWFELANLQKDRGQIDKAIEANNQALTNCKDKDDEYKAKLETQKEMLVKQKLLESIQRIELGKDPSRPAETSTCPTSLRQALTGAQKTMAGTKEKRHTNGTAKGKERRGAAVAKQMRKKVEANRNDKQRKQANSSSEDLSKDGDKKTTTPPNEEKKENVKELPDAKPITVPPLTTTKKHPPEPDTLLQIAMEQQKKEGKTVGTQVEASPVDDENSEDESVEDDAHNELNQSDGPVDGEDEDDDEDYDDADAEDDDDVSHYEDSADGGDTRSETRSTSTSTTNRDQESEAKRVSRLTQCVIPDNLRALHDEVEQYQSPSEDFGAHVRPSTKEVNVRKATSNAETVYDSTACQTERSHPIDLFVPYNHDQLHLVMGRHWNIASGMADEWESECTTNYVTCDYDPPVMGEERLKIQAKRKCRRSNNAMSTQTTVPALNATIEMEQMVLQAAQLPDISSNFLDFEKFNHHMLQNMAVANSKEPAWLGNAQEAMAELVTLGMSCLNAQRFLSRTEELLHILDNIYDVELVRACLQKVFPRKPFPERSEAQKALNETSFAGGLMSGPLLKEVFASLSQQTVEDLEVDGTDDEDQDENAREARKATRMMTGVVEGVTTVEGTEQETITLLKSLFGKELLAYNHQMSLLMEKVDFSVTLVEDARVALESAEAKKLLEGVKKHEAKIAELESKIKTLEANANREREIKKKIELEKQQASERADEERTRADQLAQQLKEKRNEMKKVEKKQRTDENRVTELQTESADLDEKLKMAKREIDALKKKSTEERSKARKDLDKSAEQIRRLEADATEKEVEREKERAAAESKLRKAVHDEAGAQKERKSVEAKLIVANERARKSEIAVLELELQTGLRVLERALTDAQKQEEAFEAVLKGHLVRGSSTEQDYKKAVVDWKAVRSEIGTMITKSKTEFAAACDTIRSGSKTLSSMTKPVVSEPPAAPKSLPPLRVEPVPVSAAAVAPSMVPGAGRAPVGAAATHGHSMTASTSTTVPVLPVAPAVGVIGQPRTPLATRERHAYHSSPVRTASMASSSIHAPQATFGRAASPPLPLSTDSPVKSLPPIGVRPVNHINSVPSSSSIGGGVPSQQSSSASGSGTGSSSTTSAFLSNLSRGGLASDPSSSVWNPLSTSTWEPFGGYGSSPFGAAPQPSVTSASNNSHSNTMSSRAPVAPFSLSGTGVTGGGTGVGIGPSAAAAAASLSAASSTRSTPYSPYEAGISHDLAQLSWNAPEYGAPRAPTTGPGGSAPPPGWTPGWGSAPLGAPGSQMPPSNSNGRAMFNS
ncbi:hypothetical protein PFISCL1PPCAC_6551 [Pristionchus fissidentatus]|uniref:MATH domain-containing protein n=1 Tax=Pristionchus fissidentatus TaxID=1538716 RepID=A0AAV5V9Q2_9BILA|nr:hypothetical protein PFISCL1PPCAC_6551 [Pristionchus fissidentatus]